LLHKQGTAFWHRWKSKFEHGRPNCCTFPVSGISDTSVIAENLASHFAKVCTPNTEDGAGKLKAKYDRMRGSYCGPSYDSSCDFDAELMETVITKMKRGKAAGLASTVTHCWCVCYLNCSMVWLSYGMFLLVLDNLIPCQYSWI